jgi:cobalamin biosynthesis protein CobW
VNPVPSLIVAGYLGSGKTTLVAHLLKAAQADGIRLAIVSNEFGDTGIDRALLDAGEDGLVELDGGCVCCRLSDVLSTTLETLLHKVEPDRLVLECSGVALPGEIVIQFWRPPLDALVSDEVVVVVVDAEQAASDTQPDDTWTEQLEAADLVVLNKIDRVDAAGLVRARARVDAVTGGRPVIPASFARVDPSLLFPPDPEGLRQRRRDPNAEVHAHDHERFTTRELRFDALVEEAEVLSRVAAMDAIRAKGFVRTPAGLRVVQGVGDRIALTEPARPVPDHLVGIVVVIHREKA